MGGAASPPVKDQNALLYIRGTSLTNGNHHHAMGVNSGDGLNNLLDADTDGPMSGYPAGSEDGNTYNDDFNTMGLDAAAPSTPPSRKNSGVGAGARDTVERNLLAVALAGAVGKSVRHGGRSMGQSDGGGSGLNHQSREDAMDLTMGDGDGEDKDLQRALEESLADQQQPNRVRR